MNYMQSALTRMVNTSRTYAFRHPKFALVNSLTPSLRDSFRAHMISLGNPHAGRWLLVLPRNSAFELSDDEYVSAMRARLHLQWHNVPLKHCACDMYADSAAYVDDPLHALSCRLTRGRQITMRHNGVVKALAHAIERCGMVPIVEPAGCDWQTDRRPDIEVFGFKGQHAFIDVGIVHPPSRSYRTNAGSRPLAVVRQYEKRKVDKYRQMAIDNDAIFIPFILETTGGYGEVAVNTVRDVVTHAQMAETILMAKDIHDEMMDRIAIVMQQGNAAATRQSRNAALRVTYRRKRPTRSVRQPSFLSDRQRPMATSVLPTPALSLASSLLSPLPSRPLPPQPPPSSSPPPTIAQPLPPPPSPVPVSVSPESSSLWSPGQYDRDNGVNVADVANPIDMDIAAVTDVDEDEDDDDDDDDDKGRGRPPTVRAAIRAVRRQWHQKSFNVCLVTLVSGLE